MSTSTTHLSLPFIQGGQAQKHVTHNEAIRQLDSIVQLSVLDQVQAPLGGEQTGDRYIIAPGAIEAFAGHDGQIALHDNGGWIFLTPNTGWIAFDEASGEVVAFNGTIWGGMGTGTTTFTPQLGINATADATNRLAVSSDASLLNHGGSGGHQVKINKSGSGDTASLLFQTGYSGRAEMGTSGSDDFEIKVSADGSAFHSALKVDAASGFVNLPNTLQTPGQVVNAAGHLGTAYNYPSNFSFDPITTPGLPGAFSASGYYSGAAEMDEFIAVDPNQVYRLGAYMRQESVSGNWSSYAQDERHSQYIGLRCYDADGFSIGSGNHARYRHNGQDSLTTLTQPLEPGDTVVHVANADGWN